MVDLINLKGLFLRVGDATDSLQDDLLDVGLRKSLEYKDAEGYEHENSLVGAVWCLPTPAQKGSVQLERRILRRSTNELWWSRHRMSVIRSRTAQVLT